MTGDAACDQKTWRDVMFKSPDRGSHMPGDDERFCVEASENQDVTQHWKQSIRRRRSLDTARGIRFAAHLGVRFNGTGLILPPAPRAGAHRPVIAFRRSRNDTEGDR
jgi:hypothetical protein